MTGGRNKSYRAQCGVVYKSGFVGSEGCCNTDSLRNARELRERQNCVPVLTDSHAAIRGFKSQLSLRLKRRRVRSLITSWHYRLASTVMLTLEAETQKNEKGSGRFVGENIHFHVDSIDRKV